ncbi:MFS transporter [Haloplanus sp. GCM10025708]|uniref:MFS transporter n=1 Tax=Haloplanus sp. GCM10025708 TaxID=3252679 RepID=UPI0036193C55
MREWRGVGLVGGWQLTASVCFYAIFAGTAFVRETFGLSRTLVGVTVTATMLGYTLLLFAMGAAVDGYGERPVMIGGLLGLGIGSVGVAVAPSYPTLLAALLLVGATYATAMPATNRAVLAVAPDGRRNLAMSVKQVGVTAGSGLSALLVTGIAATRFGWRASFLVVAALAFVVTLVFAAGYDGDGGSGALAVPDVRSLLDSPATSCSSSPASFSGPPSSVPPATSSSTSRSPWARPPASRGRARAGPANRKRGPHRRRRAR